jgi:hypothetical protein
MAADEPTLWRYLKEALSIRDIAILLWALAGGSTLATLVSRHVFPLGWDPLSQFYAALAAFFIGAVVSKQAYDVTRWVGRRGSRLFQKKPQIKIQLHSGTEAFLEVTNTGGPAVIWGEGQIVKLSSGSIKHQAPYLMRWKNRATSTFAKQSQQLLRSNEPQFLSVASLNTVIGYNSVAYSVLIIGNTGNVDSYRFDQESKDSPIVTVRVTFKAEPELADPTSFIVSFVVKKRGDIVILFNGES